jgi:hypothetical protein
MKNKTLDWRHALALGKRGLTLLRKSFMFNLGRSFKIKTKNECSGLLAAIGATIFPAPRARQ